LSQKIIGIFIALEVSKIQRVEEKMENSKKEKNLPWLNADGTKKTDAEIEKSGRTWSSETWNRYLDSSVGTLRDDNLSFFHDMDTDEMSEKAIVIQCLNQGKYREELETALLIALDRLTNSEKFIIKESFWKGVHDKDIAKKMKSPHKSVRVLKSRALKKLGQILSGQQLKDEILHLKNSNLLSNVISLKKQWIQRDSLTFR